MSMQVDDPALDGYYPPSSRGCAPYEPSIASSASSSQASIFSDSSSVQSSIASSISDDFRQSQEDARDRACAQAQLRQQQLLHESYLNQPDPAKLGSLLKVGPPAPQSYADVTSVPAQQRQHPRRSSLNRHQKPPALVRQCERKINFVDNLVDSATQMVEVVWPLSVVPCRGESGGGRGVLPLRTYIEETLRRSRTSYSTLQVALYYLVLIKDFIPKTDFTQEQSTDCPANRALMCGRRMFLAALILASKYLQDRNYSAKAWSKMSGLKVAEINTNERTFLSKVNWKLHIPETIFKKWTEIVLKYTPSMQPPPSDSALAVPIASWKSIIPRLTPELDNIPILDMKFNKTSMQQCTANLGFATPTTPTAPKSALTPMHMDSTSNEGTPTPLTVLPRYLEPKPDMVPPTPPLARMGPLPTPQLTPSSVAASTPAVSACGSRRPSMCSAMAVAQKAGFNRCAMDTFPTGGFPGNKDQYPFASRRPSIASAASTRSSPESMLSDRSRSSRASSISSISTVSSNASIAPNRACLARQATCRNATRLPLIPQATEEKEGSVTQPILIVDDAEMVSSPELADFSVNTKVLHTPHRHSKHAHAHAHPSSHLTAGAGTVSASSAEKSRKRCRSRGNRRSDLQEEVRLLLQEASDEMMEVDLDDDDVVVEPSPAAECATRMLARTSSQRFAESDTRGFSSGPQKEVQPPASLSRRGSYRLPVPVQSLGGDRSKRTCCSTAAAASRMDVSPAPARLFGEITSS